MSRPKTMPLRTGLLAIAVLGAGVLQGVREDMGQHTVGVGLRSQSPFAEHPIVVETPHLLAGPFFLEKSQVLGALSQFLDHCATIAQQPLAHPDHLELPAMAPLKGLLMAWRKDESLNTLFLQDAGVVEGFNLYMHHAMVLQRLCQQIPYYNLSTRLAPSLQLWAAPHYPIRGGVEGFLALVLSLHDIGKGLAIHIKQRRSQNLYNTPVVVALLEGLGLPPSHVDLAKALVDHDDVGQYIQGKATLEKAVEGFQARSGATGLPLETLYRLQMAYYISDAASYPYLLGALFQGKNPSSAPLWPAGGHHSPRDLEAALGVSW